jgi:hypothetical protein
MQLSTLAGVLAAAGVAAAQNATKPQAFGLFGDNPIYIPDSNHTIFYPRITELADGTILATAGLNSTPAVFPIFSSSDGGATWKWISNMTDQVNGLGMNAQPAIYELPFAVGKFPAGTVLASGNSWSGIPRNGSTAQAGPNRNSTIIDLYASTDKGYTWKFVSNVARGSGPSTQNGVPCIWEPYIL